MKSINVILTEKDIKKFMKIMKEECDVELEFDQARIVAKDVLELLVLIYEDKFPNKSRPVIGLEPAIRPF